MIIIKTPFLKLDMKVHLNFKSGCYLTFCEFVTLFTQEDGVSKRSL